MVSCFPDISPPRFFPDRFKPTTEVELLLHLTPDQEHAQIFPEDGASPEGTNQSPKLLASSTSSDLKLKSASDQRSAPEFGKIIIIIHARRRFKNRLWKISIGTCSTEVVQLTNGEDDKAASHSSSCFCTEQVLRLQGRN